ncbi:DUF6233 domain-containing protein [Streptomyces kanasensis]|uniref:DUF6233 domain-containing protein n=1 Tax=Streptomyces kanasensis TaxID=936756 RepID=UPI000ABB0CDC|nr:DUF6233 domain-containing protein [Streptomyces kanasensis]
MSVPSDQPADAVPLPVRVLLPTGEEVTGRLWGRRQLPEGWVYDVGLPGYSNRETGEVEPVEYRVWLPVPQYVRPVDGVAYDAVPTEHLPAPSVVEQLLGPRRPSGWVLQKLGGRHVLAQGVVHAVDCAEAPKDAPPLALDQALAAAERPGVRLCSLCGASAELDPVLKGFDQGFQD